MFQDSIFPCFFVDKEFWSTFLEWKDLWSQSYQNEEADEKWACNWQHVPVKTHNKQVTFSNMISKHFFHLCGANPRSKGIDINRLWTRHPMSLRPLARHTAYPKPDGDAAVRGLHFLVIFRNVSDDISTSTSSGVPLSYFRECNHSFASSESERFCRSICPRSKSSAFSFVP